MDLQPSPQQREIDRVLYLRRISQARSCYPCRQRKVKCDHGQPCQTCQKRGHPEICSYNVGTSEKKRGRRAKAAAASVTPVRASRRRDSEPEPESDPEPGLEPPRRNAEAGPQNTAATANYHPPRKELYQGGSSVLTMLHGSADSPAVEMRRKAGPLLGLHNTLEFYPFMKIKTLQERWAELLKIIPQKQEVLRYFPSHGATIYPLSPVLLDPDGLESTFCDYLAALEAGELRSPNVISTKWVCKAYISQIALILAALATSAHYSVMQSPKKRSEHCLDFDVGQSDGAWVMMGTTVRAAQALGLHTQSASQQSEEGAKKKQALWYVYLQDCLLSLCHGRPHIASKQSLATQNSLRSNEPLDFSEMMCGIVSVSTSLLELEKPNCEASMKLLTELDGYRSRAVPYLQHREKCTNIQQRYESLSIEIQLFFAVSVLCRPALTKFATTENGQTNVIRALKSRAKESLMNTAKAFIEFQALSIIPIRTWSLIHAVLSATILLCLWEETRCDQESRDVLQRVMEIFSRAAQADDETGMMVDASGNNNWLSMNHTRALVALQNAIQKAPALHTCGSLSTPEREQAENVPQQNYSLPRDQDAAPIDPMMDAVMGYNFTAMLGDRFVC
ncbi:uncharacterized protein TRIVIDRAFT_154034 [Trichoderma virens Gv29-8]|uniref:Zn(2)-C6 fungal-type domain-containing protein n=1 Tax=Hypocrea virens (strain Gv29-8 / FGSC 10586) TaxID=413071 RepID=G9MXT9_HYPVG|nr:uncharacterized protein TRIVIDRAFT_154034 [Trichoderma virens Gv29-8]EHK20700.1 hypothetical protein TRIVIDRAFT_154034 [Trichoderma virens Gv29-8]